MSSVSKRTVEEPRLIQRRDFMRWGATGVVLTALGTPMLMAGTAQASGSAQRLGGRAGRSLFVFTNGDSFILPVDQVGSGLVTMTLFNSDFGSDHQAQIARLRPGASAAGFGDAIAAHNVGQALGMLAGFAGGPNVVAPGAIQTTYQDLSAGHYILLCFVPDLVSHLPHFAMGMFAGFDVVGPTIGPAAPENVATTVKAIDEKRFAIPTTLRRHSVIRFENHAATDVHEFSIGQLLPGKTTDNLIAWASNHQGPPPFLAKGGVGGLNPGGAAWFKLTLPRGLYVAFCLVPDDMTNVAHAADGMVSAFTIT